MKKSILNVLLSSILITTTGVTIFTRVPSLAKLGLGLISIAAIGTNHKLSQKINLKEAREYETQIKALTSQLAFKDIEIENNLKSLEELTKKHESEIVDLTQHHNQEIGKLTIEAQNSCEDSLKLTRYKHSLELNREKSAHKGEIDAFNDVINALKKDKQALEGNIKVLQQQCESIKIEANQHTLAVQTEFKKLEDHRKQFEIEKKEWRLNQLNVQHHANQKIFNSSRDQQEQIASEWASLRTAQLAYNKTIQENQHLIDQTIQENQVLKEQLAQYVQALNQNNGRYNVSSLEGHTAHEIEQFFARQKLPIKYLEGKESKSTSKLTLRFDALEENKAKIIKMADALSKDVFGGQEIVIDRDRGYLSIVIPLVEKIANGSVLDPNDNDWEWLYNFIINSNHWITLGGTGDGKTTFISNLAELAGLLLENPELRILNPKPTETKFYFRGERRWATYLNTETPSGCTTPNCREGLEQLLYILNDRMATAQRIEEKNRKLPEDKQIPYPNFTPLLIVIFECNFLRSYDDDMKKLFDEVVAALSKVGREYKVKCVLEGQDTTCGEWGMKRAAFQCFSRIYLASVLNTTNVKTQEIKFLKDPHKIEEQIELCKSQRSESDEFSPFNYYGLFIQQGNSPRYVKYLPAPNYFHDNLVRKETIECPNCGSEKVVKNGSKRGRQYYKCNSCEAQFANLISKTSVSAETVDIWDEEPETVNV